MIRQLFAQRLKPRKRISNAGGNATALLIARSAWFHAAIHFLS